MSTFLTNGETLVIERRGTPVAVVVPLVAVDRERKARALAGFGDTLRAVLDAHGLDEANFEAAVTDDTPGR